jgi:proline iminopeptidase
MIKQFAILTLIYLLSLPTICNGQKDGIASSTDNAPVYYKTYGTGKPLLIINGGPGMNSAGFENLAAELSRNNTTIIYDQRGTGKSVLKSLDSTTITIKLMADDIECIRKQLKIEKWSILGHSFGGMLASYYAVEHPSCIEKIILSSSGGIDLSLLNYVQASINSKLSKAELDSVNYWTQKINNGDTSYSAKLARGQILAKAYVLDKSLSR